MAAHPKVKAPDPVRAPLPLDHLPKKQVRRASAPVCFSEDASDALAAAEVALVVASPKDRKKAQEALDAARDAVRDATVWFHFRSVGVRFYDELVAAHPPTEEQWEKYHERRDVERSKPLGQREHVEPPYFNLQTFAPALIAACLVEVSRDEKPTPEATRSIMEPAEVAQMTSGPEWNVAEMQALFDGAMTTITTRGITLGKGSR